MHYALLAASEVPRRAGLIFGVTTGGASLGRNDLVRFIEMRLGSALDMSMEMRLVAWVDKGTVEVEYCMVGRRRVGMGDTVLPGA